MKVLLKDFKTLLMKILLISIFLWLMEVMYAQVDPQEGHRISKIINNEWTFNYFPDAKADKGYESMGFDDSTWPIVALPHTWSTFETTGELHPFIHDASEKNDTYWWYGWGWYRKHFIVKKEYAEQKVFIEFEGVQKYSKVWINGHYLGDHEGGYGSFDFDVTSFIKRGEDNVLAVAVNNRQNDPFRIPPMAAGNFDVYGGIYRDVTLVLKDKLYIPMQGSASHEGGTFVTTPSVSENMGIVRVQTWVKNDYNLPKNCTLKTTIFDAQDNVVQVMQSNQQIRPGELFRFDQMSKPVSRPYLWSHDNPYTYKIYSEVTDNKQVVDTYSSPLGFRWFWWDYKNNFLYMNGKKVVIHGGNRHQEYPWLGDAIPKWITKMDYQDIAENLNYNFMRTVHYPNDKLVYELTDKYGIAIDEETPSIKNQVFSIEVQEQQMKEMIRRDRNHPSIVIWSMGNETNHATDSKYAVAEDTTRIITARRVLEGSAGAHAPHSDENLGIESLLRCTIRGWYNKDVKDLEPKDGQHCGSEEHQQNMLIASKRLGTGNLCTWIYADHGCDRQYLNCPLKYINPKGYVDSYRIPKYSYFLWQATYAKEPMAFILPHFWRSQYLGQKKNITVDSNCDTLELKVNGISKGLQFPSDANFHAVTFKGILVEKGTLSVVGRKNGRSAINQVVMAEEPARIVLTASHQKIEAERSSVAIIKADIVDAQGTHVYGATNTVRWIVTGPATLVGPQVYVSDIDKNDQTEGTMYTDMPVANLIRSTGKPGQIRVTVSASGLASGIVDIVANPVKRDTAAFIEPVLADGKRIPVLKVTNRAAQSITLPEEMKETTDEINVKLSGKAEYTTFIKKYIVRQNPALDTSSVEFGTLISLFASHLLNNYGRLVADDYNFSTNHFNKCRQISKYIDSTNLPAAFKKGLKVYYTKTMIGEGSEKDYITEKQWINSIPTEGKVVMIQKDRQKLNAGEGIITTEITELADIVALIYPDFINLDEGKKSVILKNIGKINPFIKNEVIGEQDRKNGGKKTTKIIYKVDTGQPILIPDLKFMN